MIWLINHLLAGIYAYLLYVKKQSKSVDITIYVVELIPYLCAGWYALGYVIGKYYK